MNNFIGNLNNLITKWWRSQQFKSALQRGNTGRAIELLKEIQKSGAKFSLLEKLYIDKIQLERSVLDYKREVVNLRQQITQSSNSIDDLKLQLAFDSYQEIIFKPNQSFIENTLGDFQLINQEDCKIQCMGIDINIFENLEKSLVEYLEDELKQKSLRKSFSEELKKAYLDIQSLKKGKDPDYKYSLTPHIYFMRYFLEGVYSAYIAWFLVYQAGLLKPKINVLDIGAGSGAILYGLFTFLNNLSSYEDLSPVHISYCSFEKQKLLQYYGLQFWRKYTINQINPAVNSYWRFYTNDIFQYECNNDLEQLPSNFYDFISISHCIFANKKDRIISHEKYRLIFQSNLKRDGYVLIVVQGRRLFQAYESQITDDELQEKQLMKIFLDELGLNLVWYKYVTSTNQRKPMSPVEFSKFATEKLPSQKYMSLLAKQYLAVNYDLNYALDDYIILARK